MIGINSPEAEETFQDSNSPSSQIARPQSSRRRQESQCEALFKLMCTVDDNNSCFATDDLQRLRRHRLFKFAQVYVMLLFTHWKI